MSQARHPFPPLVALAAWLVPGAGYFLLGQRKRGLTIGLTVVGLFLCGLLIGGVRCLEVPGYSQDGDKLVKSNGDWVLSADPLAELREKPWSIPQTLTGPIAVACMKWSVWASTDPDKIGNNDGPRVPPGIESYARVNDIGVLYTAVAGMLNLLAIIDSAYRAAADDEEKTPA